MKLESSTTMAKASVVLIALPCALADGESSVMALATTKTGFGPLIVSFDDLQAIHQGPDETPPVYCRARDGKVLVNGKQVDAHYDRSLKAIVIPFDQAKEVTITGVAGVFATTR